MITLKIGFSSVASCTSAARCSSNIRLAAVSTRPIHNRDSLASFFAMRNHLIGLDAVSRQSNRTNAPTVCRLRYCQLSAASPLRGASHPQRTSQSAFPDLEASPARFEVWTFGVSDFNPAFAAPAARPYPRVRSSSPRAPDPVSFLWRASMRKPVHASIRVRG